MSVNSCISRVFSLNISQSVVSKQSCNTYVVSSVHKLTVFVAGLDVFNLDRGNYRNSQPRITPTWSSLLFGLQSDYSFLLNRIFSEYFSLTRSLKDLQKARSSFKHMELIITFLQLQFFTFSLFPCNTARKVSAFTSSPV